MIAHPATPLKASRFRLATLLLAALAVAASATAQNVTWNGGNVTTDSNWSDALNWSGGVAPVATNALFFDGLAGLTNTNNLAAGTSFTGLTFNSTAGNFTLGGNSLALAGNITDNAAGNETVNLAVALGQTSNFTVAAGGNLTLVGVISGTGFGLNVTGPGDLSLNGTNTFTGASLLNSGTVFLNNGAGLGTGTINLAGGTLAASTTVNNAIVVASSSTIYQDTANNLTLANLTVNAGATLNILIPGGNTTTVNSAVAGIYGSTGIAGNGTIELGTSTGSFRLTSSGSGHGGGNITIDLGTATASLTNRNGNQSFYWGALEGGSGTFLRGASSTNAATTYFIGNNNQSTTFSGSIVNGSAGTSATVGITKTGSGTLTLNGGTTSNYSGVTSIGNSTVPGGTLAVTDLNVGGSNSSIGASTNAAANLVINGGTLQYLGSGSNTTDRLVTVGGNGATIDASGAGTLTFSNTGSIVFSAAQANALTLTGSNTGANTFKPIISSNTGATSLTKSGVGEWVLTGTNTYTGATTINSGTLAISTLALGGAASNIGQSSNAAANLVFNGGTLQYLGVGNTTDRLFTVGANGATIDSSGTGPVTFSNTTNIVFTTPATPQNPQITLTGSNTGANTLAPGITDVDGTNLTSVVKNGTGQWILTNSNTYSGGTTINSGTLNVTNASGSATGSGAVTLNSGATLAGNGTIAGAVTANTGSVISPGNTTSNIGLLTLGSLTLAANSGSSTANLTFAFTNSTTYDQINVTGLNGLTVNGGAFNFYLTGTTTPFGTNGVYDLIQFNGSVQGGFPVSSLTVNNPQPNTNYVFGTNGNFLTVTIANAVLPNSWNLDANGVWSNSTAWSTGVPAPTATAIFGNVITAPRTITLDSSQTVAGLDFTSSISYTIAPGSGTLSLINDPNPGNITVASGSHTVAAPIAFDSFGLAANVTAGSSVTISGNLTDNGSVGAFTKTGNGQLNLLGNNTFSGPVNLSAGTLSFGGLPSLGTSNTLNLSGGSLQWNATYTDDISNGGLNTVTINSPGVTLDTNGNNVTIANPIGNSGAGNLTKAGNGQLNLLAANTYSGGTNINQGTLSFGALANLGTGSTIGFNGGTLQWNGTNTADITNGGLNTITIGPGGATFDTNGNNVTLTGNIGNSGTGSVTKVGNGILALLGNDTYSGATIITGGTLSFAALNSLGTGSALTLNGGTLQWYGTNTADVSSSHTLTFGTAGATFDTNGNSVTLASAIGNGSSGSLTKIGNGALTLSATPTYTGNTTVNGGTLAIGGATTFGASTDITVNSGATLTVPTGGALTLNNLLGNGTVNLATGSLTYNTPTNQTYSGLFAGTGSLTKTGSSNLTISAASPTISTYAGTLTISAGNIEVDSPGNLTAGGGSVGTTAGTNLFINGGNFESTGTFTIGSSGSSNTGFWLQAGNATFATLTTDASAANNVHPFIVVNGGNLFATALSIAKTSGTQTNFGEGGLVVSGGNATIGTLTAANNNSNGQISVQGGNLTAGTIILGNQSSAGRGAQFQITSGSLTVNSTANNGFVLIKPNGTNVAQVVTATFSGGTSNLAQLTFGNDTTVQNGTATVTISSGAQVFIGSGGIVNNAPALIPTFNLNGGILGAFANWSSSLPLALGGTTFQTSDVNNNPFNITLNGIVSGSGASLIQNGGGTLALTALNTYTGNTTINGAVAVSTLVNGGLPSGLGQSSNAPANLIINNGTLQYIGTTNTSTDRSFTVTGTTTTLDASGTGNATYSNLTAINYATSNVPNTLVLTGNGTGANTIATNIGDNGSGATSLVKNGSGSWIASGANNLSGPTTINSGILTLNTLPNSGVTINPGGALNPVNGVGTLTIPSLTLAAPSGGLNATLNFDFASASPGGYDQIITTNTNGLTFNGGAFNLYNVGTTTPWAGVGVYDLIQFSGSVQGGLPVSQLTVLDPDASVNYAFSINGNFLQLAISGNLGPNTWSFPGNGNWSVGSNWTTGVPASNVVANFLASAITAPTTITLDGSQTVAGLFFNSANAYTIAPGSGSLSLVGVSGAPANVTVTLGNHILAAPVILGATGLAANITSPNSLTISGNISDNGAGANITTIGTGTLALSGNNTYTGGTFLNSGILNFNGTASLGLGNITFHGGTLQWAANSTTDISSLPIFFNGSSAILDTNGNNVTLANNFGVGSTGSLTKTGNGVLTLSGTNTYSGGTFLNQGELGFTTTSNFGTGALTFNGGGLQWGAGITTDISGISMTFTGNGLLDTNGNNVTLANSFGNHGAGGLVKNGNGVLTLSPPSFVTTGNLTSGTATVPVNSVTGLFVGQIVTGANISAGTTIASISGNTVTLSNAPNATLTASSLTFAGTEFYSGNTTINAGTLALGTGSAIPTASTVVINSSGNLDASAVNASLNSVTGTGVLNLGTSNFGIGSSSLTSTFSGSIQGTNVINKLGSGTWTLAGVSPYSGAITINGGTIAVATGGSLNNITSSSVAATAGTELLINGGSLTASASTNVGAGSNGLLITSGSATFNGGLTEDFGSTNNAIITASGGTLTASSLAIGRGSNTTNATQPAAGVTTQGLYINGGTVNITGDLDMSTSTLANSMVNTRMDSGSLTVGGTVNIGINNGSRWAILDINGGTFTDANTTTGVVIAGGFNTSSAGNAIWTVRAGTSSVGRIQVGQNGTATGAAVLSISGGNLYVGSGGIVQGTSPTTDTVSMTGGVLGAYANWSSPLPITLNGGVIQAADQNNNPFNVTLAGAIGGSGNLTKTGTGILVVSGTNTYNGITNINAGTLQIGNAGSTGSLGTGGIVNDNGTLAFDRSDTSYQLNDTIVGSGSVVQNGTGMTTLSGANTYSGNTVINAGTLAITGSTGTGNVTVNNGATLAGGGTISGNVSVVTGGILNPEAANPGSLTTLTLGSLTLATNTTLDYNFSGGANDEISVTNNNGLVINGGGFNLYTSGGTSPLTATGVYTDLFSYAGSIGGAGVSSLYVANPQLGLGYSFQAVSNQVQLTVALNLSPNSWIADDGFDSWSTTANWSSVSPTTGQGPSGVGISVYFPSTITSSQTISLDQTAVTAGSLIFGSTYGYIISQGGSNSITLNNGSNTALISDLNGNQAINVPLILTTHGANVTVAAGNSLTLGGGISDTTPANLTLNGNGNVILSGANTYRGTTFLDSGTLNLENNAALGTGNLTIAGGNLDNGSGAPVDITGLAAQFWNASFTFLGSSTNAPLDLGSSNVTLGANVTVTVATLGNDLSVDGNISGPGKSLTKSGPANLDLNGTNTFNGGLNITNGNVNLGTVDSLAATGNVTITTGGNLNINASDQSIGALTLTNGNVTGTGNLSATAFNVVNGNISPALGGSGNFTQSPGGIVTLLGASNYTGSTTVLGGNLVLAGGSNTLPATTSVALGSTGNTAILQLGNSNGNINQTLAGLTVTAGTGSVRGGNSAANSTLDLNIASGDDIFTGVIGDGSNSTTSAGNHLTVVKDGAGEFDFQGGNSTFLGGITLDAGTLGLTTAGTVAGVGPITFNGGTLQAGNATTSFSATYPYALIVPTGTNSGINTVGNTSMSFSGTVSGNGTLNLAAGPVTSFSGNLAFAAFNGTLNLTANGTVRLQGAYDHGLANATVNLGNNGTLITRDGSNQNIGILLGAAGSTLGGSSVGGNTTWTIGGLNIDDTYNGNITNAGAAGSITSLTKAGTGNLTLTGTSTYNGTTTINSGTLVLGSGTASSSSSLYAISSGATFNVNGQTASIGGLSGAGNTTLGGGALTTGLGNGNNTYSGILSGIGTLNKSGTGNLTLSGIDSLAGPVTVNSGGLVLPGNLTASDVVVNSGATLVGSGTSGNVGGALTLETGGHLSLAPANTTLLTVGSFTWNTDGSADLFYTLGTGSTSGTLNVLGTFAQGTSPSPGNPGQFIFDFQSSGFFGGVYTLLDFGSSSGFAPTDFAYQNLGAGLQGQFNLQGNSLTFSVSAVPEPADAALALGALTLLVAVRRRRAKKSAQLPSA